MASWMADGWVMGTDRYRLRTLFPASTRAAWDGARMVGGDSRRWRQALLIWEEQMGLPFGDRRQATLIMQIPGI